MSNPNTTTSLQFQSIGKTDELKTVSCQATKHFQLKYSSKPNHIKSQIFAKNHNALSGQNKTTNFYRFKQQEENNERKKKQYFSKTHNLTNQDKITFWPTDLIQDQSGQTLQKLKSYIQSHKINTYIKHDLSNLEFEKEIKSKNNYQVTIQQNFNQKTHMRSFSQNNKNKILRIDYQVITIHKENSNKNMSFYTKNRNKSSEPKINTQTPNSTNKFMKTSDIKVSPSLKKLHENSPKASSMTKTHQSPIHTKLKSREELQQNFVQCKTLDIHERQYLTPNTSTYFQSLNNSIEIQPQSISPQKYKERNHKSYIHIKNEQKQQNKSKSFMQKQPKTTEKIINQSQNCYATDENWKNKYKILEANNYYDSLTKYKNIINISNNI